MQIRGQGTERYLRPEPPLGPGALPANWINQDHLYVAPLYGPHSNLSWYPGFWPSGSFSSSMLLEPGQWPKYSQSPWSNPRISEPNAVHCGPTRPCPFGTESNMGTPVWINGRIERRGMCVRGRCDSPLGQDETGAGTALRSWSGDIVWPQTQLVPGITGFELQ
jgi:hypothetical protein